MQKLISTANELVTFKNSQGQQARGTILKLAQSYIVFEVYNPYSIVQLSEILSEMKIVRANKEIYQGKAVVTNLVNTGMLLIVSATLSESGWQKDFDIASKESLNREIGFLIDSYAKEQLLSIDFKLSVMSLKSFLNYVKNWFDKLEPFFERMNVETDKEFFLNNFGKLLDQLSNIYNNFSKIATNIDSDSLDLCKDFLQNNLHPLLMSSPFLHRTYYKPLGFAGDYMMMHMIQRDTAEGISLFAKFVNVFACRIPIMYSVNNRTNKLVNLITEGVKKAEKEGREFHSFSIGCGPALEVKKFIESYDPKVKCNITLLDFNQETLEFAACEARKSIGDKNINIITQLNSVHTLLKKSVNSRVEEKRYDLVYCSGLFDYLSDKVCSKLTRMFFKMLKEEGKVFVTNMHSKDIDHYSLEMLLEWYLIYRDEENMSKFAPDLGSTQKIYTDSTGINLWLEIHK